MMATNTATIAQKTATNGRLCTQLILRGLYGLQKDRYSDANNYFRPSKDCYAKAHDHFKRHNNHLDAGNNHVEFKLHHVRRRVVRFDVELNRLRSEVNRLQGQHGYFRAKLNYVRDEKLRDRLVPVLLRRCKPHVRPAADICSDGP